MRQRLIVLLLTVGACTRTFADECALSQMAVSGAAYATTTNGTANLSVGLVGGIANSPAVVASFGPQYASKGAFSCFLSTGAPPAVAALPGTASVRRLVESAGRAMTLEWTRSSGRLPATYSVFVGTSPAVLAPLAEGLTDTSRPLQNLDYQTAYFWQVMAVDPFGRRTPSGVYSFSIAPTTDHLIAAPNPFHPGVGTTLLFSMPGAGGATVEIYSLPDVRRVFRRRYDGLQNGLNTITYDGRDDGGRLLPNGVFTVRLIKNGAQGNATELFRLLSVR